MSTNPLDPARLAEIRTIVGTHHYDDPEVAELLAEVDRLTKALAAERAARQRVEVLATAWQRQPRVVTYLRTAGQAVLAALAGDTEGAGR